MAMLRSSCRVTAICLSLLLALGADVCAQTHEDSGKVLVIGTKVAAPFAMKTDDGQWTGISIDLWKRIADQLGLKYQFVEEPTVNALIEATQVGKFDAAIAAITVTPDRERVLEFSQPYYVSGLGIAVSSRGYSIWVQIGWTLTSFGFLQAVAILIAIALAMGTLIWLFERRHNEDFGGGALRGLGTSMWWSAEAMTQASTGHLVPKTLPGRMLAVLWMVVSVIALAVFTAGVTSAITTAKLQGLVNDAADLPSVRVGAVMGSATIGYLSANRIRSVDFRTADDGLRALEAGAIDAFVYDRPLLSWIVLDRYASTLRMLDASFDPQTYAVAFPRDSALRKPTNIEILEATHSEWWKDILFRYLGER